MTCIVGLKDKKGNIFMGGDSAGVNWHRTTVRKDEKVFIKEEMIFGFTSSFRMGQILRYSLRIPPQNPRTDDYEYMCTEFIDAVRKCLKEKGYSTIKDNEETGGTFIVGYKGNLYQVDSDFQVGMVYDNYMAVGCGEDFAKGVLFLMNKENKYLGESGVRMALLAADYFSGGVREPFVVLELKGEGNDNQSK